MIFLFFNVRRKLNSLQLNVLYGRLIIFTSNRCIKAIRPYNFRETLKVESVVVSETRKTREQRGGRRERRRAGAWRKKGLRGGNQEAAPRFLQGAVWAPPRRWGACSARGFPASGGSPHVEPGVRNFLEILKPRPEWFLRMYNTNIPRLKRRPRPKFCNCLQQQELLSFSFPRKNYVWSRKQTVF